MASFTLPTYEPPNDIQTMTRDRLKKYLEDDAEFIEYFHRLPYIKKCNALIQELKNQAQQLGRENMTLEDKVKQAKQTLEQCEADLVPTQSEYDRLKEHQEEFLSKFGVHTLIQRLKQSVACDEQECTRLIEKVSSQGWSSENLDSFIEAFKEKRKLIHQRQSKIEKLAEMHSLGI